MSQIKIQPKSLGLESKAYYLTSHELNTARRAVIQYRQSISMLPVIQQSEFNDNEITELSLLLKILK